MLILIPFVLLQFKKVSSSSLKYSLMNAAGSLVLAAQAGYTRQWGFLLLESAWLVVSAFALFRALAGVRAEEVKGT